MMVQDPSRQPPPWPSWTVAVIKDMVVMDAPNIKDCVILGLGSAILFLWSSSGALRGALPA